MRVLQLSKTFSFGGAENHVRDLANVLDDFGNDVYVIAFRGYQNDRLNRNVHFINMKMVDVLMPFHVFYLCRILKRYKIDVIHAHKRLPVVLASIAGWIMHVPVVVTIHGKPWYDLRSPLSKMLTSKIIFVSMRSVNKYAGYDKIKHKSVFIQNGVENTNEIVDRDFYSICYLSRIDKRHSSVISMIIKEIMPVIIKDFPAVTFNIIGDGKYLKDLKDDALAINERHNREVCLIHGYLPEVKSLVRRSGLVFGVGRAAIEALSCAVPVISLNQEFMGHFVSPQNYNFYRQNNFVAADHKPPDAGKLTSLLQEYFSNPLLYQREAVTLQGQIREDFGMTKIADAIISVYREIIKSPHN